VVCEGFKHAVSLSLEKKYGQGAGFYPMQSGEHSGMLSSQIAKPNKHLLPEVLMRDFPS
jgi:hypothetical protein